MNNKDTVNIYWAPVVGYDINMLGEWSMLYPNPTNLYSDILKLKNKNSDSNAMFSCPAFKNKLKNTFVFKNSIQSEYEYDYSNLNNTFFQNSSESFIGYNQVRKEVLGNGPTIAFNLYYIFFSEESINASFSSPFFNKAGYTKYGSVIPGEFDIGQWFRPYVFEVQLWDNSGKFIIEEDEPLFYVKFDTDKKINLQKFKHSAQLQSYAEHCTTSTKTIMFGVPLIKRYEKFKNAGMRNLILKEIKNNIIEEQ